MALLGALFLLFSLTAVVSGYSTKYTHYSFVEFGAHGQTPVSVYGETVVNGISPPISFGGYGYTTVYITPKGYIYGSKSNNLRPSTLFDSSSNTDFIIAPFWDDQYVGLNGHVKYELHTVNYNEYASWLLRDNVADYIAGILQTAHTVTVDALLIVEWSGMVSSQYSSSSSKTNKYQLLVASARDGRSYAMFTYKCGELEWSNVPVIGFKAGSYTFRNHPYSLNRSSPNPIACVNYPRSVWSNVVYEISSSVTYCYSYQFGCSSGRCVSGSDKCDGYPDCSDGTDEVACSFVSCYDGQFTCRSGGCVSSSMECDGRRDCSDGSDELDCSSISAGAIGGIISAALIVTLVFCVIIAASITYQVKQRNRRWAQFQRLQSHISIRNRNQPTPSTQTEYFCPKPGEWYQTVEGHWVQGPPPAYSGNEGNPLSDEGVALINASEDALAENVEAHLEGLLPPTTDQTPPTTDQTPPTTDQTPPTTDQTPPTVTSSDNSTKAEVPTPGDSYC